VKSLGYTGDLALQARDIVMKLYKAFCDNDALMIEVNPLATVKENGVEKVLVIDSKVSIDENAKFRQVELANIIDNSAKNPIELEADKYSLNYIRLDGNIGCLVNGAGLAMATMDIIKLHGGNPANFLDVGGSAEEEGMIEALRLLNNDPDVKSILVNIFGGILRCDLLVNAIIKATEKYNLKKAIVLRLKGTNSELVRKIINFIISTF
jgi:succinyl-CoA synthetase beta subunit